jgi:flagellar motor switch protein FliG
MLKETGGIQKAAKLLIALGDEVSALVLRKLSEDEAQRLTQEIAAMHRVQPEESQSVLEEFRQTVHARQFAASGGLDYAKKLLIEAYGPEVGKRLMSEVIRGMNNEIASFDSLQKADPQQLGKFLNQESPQTVALILSRLLPSQAAAVLQALPPAMRSEAIMRMANLEQISPDTIRKIATVIGKKLKDVGEVSMQSFGGVRAVADLLNRMESGLTDEIMTQIADEDQVLGDSIRQLMFVFEDLAMVDQNGMRILLGKVDRKVLTVALKGTTAELKEHFLKCMSQRAAEMLKEDMVALGPIRIKEVEAAQQQIIATVRQLQAEGTLNVAGSSGEQYVT